MIGLMTVETFRAFKRAIKPLSRDIPHRYARRYAFYARRFRHSSRGFEFELRQLSLELPIPAEYAA